LAIILKKEKKRLTYIAASDISAHYWHPYREDKQEINMLRIGL